MDKTGVKYKWNLVSNGLSLLLLLLLVVSVMLLFWLPIFTDEVTWLQMTGKYLQHGGYDVTLTPQCASTHKTSPPFYMIPYRILSSSMNFLLVDPGYFRIIAITKILIISVISYLLIEITFPNATHIDRLNSTLLSFSIGGGLVFFMYLRPEVSILIATLMYLYFVFLCQEREGKSYVLVLVSVVYLVLLVSIHQKTLLLLPLILMVLYREINKKRLFYTSITLFLLFYIAISSYKYYSAFFSCEENVVVDNYWSDHGVPFYLLMDSKFELFLKNMSWRIQESHQIFSNVMFINHSNRNFPPLPNYEEFLIPAYIASSASVVLLLIVISGYFKCVLQGFNGDRKQRNRKFYVGYFIFLAIAISMAQKENYFYESIVPLFLISIFGWAWIFCGKGAGRYLIFIKAVSMTVAIICVSFLAFCAVNFNYEWKSSIYGSRHPKTFSHINFSNKAERMKPLLASIKAQSNDIWLVDELIATILTESENIEIIHFSKIGVKSIENIMLYANTNVGIFHCHYLKRMEVGNVAVKKYDDLCVVHLRN